ncbi:Spore germination protein YndE [Bacillus sp. THAF10]|uniref:GerAB/ArcD/ProY family transporter n=1 Tax=Bacillus sp. THAF10 TaxID=2587848 RepID=UPI0012687D6C|nr:endospore germination permease [Bacillus sp. THAF10]QFT88486.1 Spore germination protein YndE [Bacillus sp. THAF10]
MQKVMERSISQGQLFFLIIQTQIGVGVLSLPFAVHTTAKGDGWISTILAGFVLQIWIFIIVKLARMFPEKNLFQTLRALLGKFVGNILTLAYILYFTALASLVAVLQTELITKWILPLTPYWVIYLFIIIVAVYLATDNILMIARFFSLSTGIIIFFIILVLTVYQDVNINYILPIKQTSWLDIFIGMKEVLIALAGFEVLLVIYFCVSDKKKTLKTMSLANLTTMAIYTFLVFTSLIYFSPEELPLVPEPVLYMLKAISFEVLERLDLIFLSIWVIPMTNTFIIYLFQASVGLKELFKRDTHSPFVFIIVIPIFLSSFFLRDQFLVDEIGQVFQNVVLWFAFGLPLLLLLIGMIRKLVRKEKDHNVSPS